MITRRGFIAGLTALFTVPVALKSLFRKAVLRPATTLNVYGVGVVRYGPIVGLEPADLIAGKLIAVTWDGDAKVWYVNKPSA